MSRQKGVLYMYYQNLFDMVVMLLVIKLISFFHILIKSQENSNPIQGDLYMTVY